MKNRLFNTSRICGVLFVVLSFAVFTTLSLILPSSVSAAPGINETIHFQGKVVNSDGTNISDGDYNFTFVLYDGSAGGATTLWTEAWTGVTTQVTIKDGIFAVDLGTHTPLGSSVDWNDDSIYLGVNFNADGEMIPRIRFTAVPYAFQAMNAHALWDADKDTGIQIEELADDDLILFDTAGTERMIIDNTGNVGIGIGFSFPGAKFEVRSGTNQENIRIGDGIDSTGIFTVDANPNGTVTGERGSIALDYTNGAMYINTDDGTTWDEMTVNSDLAFSSTAGIISKANSGDELVLGVTEAADVGLRIETSVNNQDDLVQISNAGNGTTNTGADGVDIDFEQASDAAGGDINAGLSIDVTGSGDTGDILSGLIISSAGISDGSLFGLNIEGITSGTGQESGITIGSGWDTGLDVNSPTEIDSTLTTTGVTTIGSGGNTFVFDPSSGPLFSGSARPAKTITVSPEYSGGTLTTFYGAGTESNTTGSMTADVETTAANDLRTFYEWNSGEASLQGYVVALRLTLPEDFSAWSTNALQIDYATESTSVVNNILDAYVYLSSDTSTSIVSNTNNSSAGAQNWETITFNNVTLDNGVAPEWDAAGETVVVYLRMRSQSDNYVRIGDIRLNYVAAF